MDPVLISSPKNQTSFKICKIVLSVYGMWPARYMSDSGDGGSRAEAVQSLLFAAWLMYFSAALGDMIHYVLNHLDEDFYQICHLLATILIAGFALSHLAVAVLHKKAYGKLFRSYYEEMHLSNYRSHDDFTMKILLAKERSLAKAVKFLTISSLMGNCCYWLVPVIVNTSSGAYSNHTVKLESVFSLTMPFDTDYDVKGWTAGFFISMPLLYATPMIGVYTTLCFSFFVSHLGGHIDILKYKIKTIVAPSVRRALTSTLVIDGKKHMLSYNIYTDEEEEIVSKTLIDIAKHHWTILKFKKSIQTVYSELLMSIYLFNMAGYCLILLQLINGLENGAVRYGLIALILLAQMSFFSLALDDISEKISSLTTELYMMPWEAMRRHNTQTLRCILLMTQKSTRFTAAGMVDVSAPVMLSVLRTTISYFAFLTTLDK